MLSSNFNLLFFVIILMELIMIDLVLFLSIFLSDSIVILMRKNNF